MNEVNNVLCCCEYIDNQEERNHILACCCNCQHLDESFDSFISGKQISNYQKHKVMGTLQDRIRVPWIGGAKKVPLELLPIVLVFLLMLVATISVYWSLFTCLFMVLLLKFTYDYSMKNCPRTHFFINWTLTTIILLFSIFEFSVVPFLEILIHENVAVISLVAGSLYCFYVVKWRSSNLKCNLDGSIELGEVEKEINRITYCPICQKSIPGQDEHFIWFDCCIGIHNRFTFVFGIGLALGALVYSANLTLTSVCHPYTFYKTILLPDDCSDVYEDFEVSLAFINGCYSLVLSCGLLIIFVYHILLISIGLTGQEWKALPVSKKLCCGLTAQRPYDHGFLNNWNNTAFKCHENHPKTVYHY